ncbi:zeta toxin family protein [Bacillus safensis]|uniref:zeta toxin family protein n=1 Tax=Bacillus safensis TaxID=561879 RepID=UPI002280D33F|nr:zeta toxin family protein [Bacillus safensis]MCY7433134.1 zeta toxin family protein [Bacillus safensis]
MKTTRSKYFIDEDYTSDRKVLHTQIIDGLFNDSQNSQEPPQAILLGGGSASGKSTLTKLWIKAYEKNLIPLICIDCDDIKTLIPEYEDIKRYNLETAAFYVHDESSDIGDFLLEKCVQERKNFIYDGTMKNLIKYKKLIELLHEHAYNIMATVVDVPIETALERNQVRFMETGRKVPEEILVKSHKEVPKTFDVIKEMVHEYVLYDTSETVPNPITEKTEDGNVTIYNEKRLEQFYSKSKLELNT